MVRLLEAIRAGRGVQPVAISGVPEGAWSLVAEYLRARLNTNVLVVAADPQALVDDLAAFDSAPAVLHYPAADVLPMDRTPPSDEIVAARLHNQAQLVRGGSRVVAASPLGLSRPAPAPESFRGGVRELKVGSGEGTDWLVSWLVEWGYSREAQVDAAGQFAVRGGIVDVFPPTESRPLRVEFFGDEVESIRGFEVQSQASITRHTEITLLPAREFPHRQAEVEPALERLRALDFSACLPEVADQWRDHIAHLAEAGYFAGVETLYPYLTEKPSSLLDYFPEPPVVLLVEAERVRAQAERYRMDTEELIASEAEHGELPRGLRSGLIPWAEVEARFGRVVGAARVHEPGAIDLGWQPPPTMVGRTDSIAAEVKASPAGGERILFATRHVDRVASLLEN